MSAMKIQIASCDQPLSEASAKISIVLASANDQKSIDTLIVPDQGSERQAKLDELEMTGKTRLIGPKNRARIDPRQKSTVVIPGQSADDGQLKKFRRRRRRNDEDEKRQKLKSNFDKAGGGGDATSCDATTPPPGRSRPMRRGRRELVVARPAAQIADGDGIDLLALAAECGFGGGRRGEQRRPPLVGGLTTSQRRQRLAPEFGGAAERPHRTSPEEAQKRRQQTRRKTLTLAPSGDQLLTSLNSTASQPADANADAETAATAAKSASVRGKSTQPYKPPKFTKLPPFRCRNSLSMVMLQNVPAQVDDNMVYKRLSEIASVTNIYLVKKTFREQLESGDGGNGGVVFVGFRSEDGSAKVVEETIELAGSIVTVSDYRFKFSAKPRKPATLMRLSKHALKQVFKFLDWRSRIICESVCRKFRTVGKEMYDSYPWSDLPTNFALTLTKRTTEGPKYEVDLEIGSLIVYYNSGTPFFKFCQNLMAKFGSFISVMNVNGVFLKHSMLQHIHKVCPNLQVICDGRAIENPNLVSSNEAQMAKKNQ